MKKLIFFKGLLFIIILCGYTFAQTDEVIMGVPQFDQNDTGLIYQDTANSKVYSYVSLDLQTKELAFDYTVGVSSDILNKRYAIGKQILVNSTGAIYSVQTDSIAGFPTDSCVVIKTKNGNYAIMQPKDKGFYIEHFGAIPDDGLDDSKAIQKAIDAAINQTITSRINAGPGTFNLSKGVVIANQLSSGEYYFTTLSLSGAIPSYSDNPVIGSTTVFLLNDSNSFCVAFHKVRNCFIENIVFLGISDYSTDISDIVDLTDTDYEDMKMRLNRYSPSCAIVIDPFDKNITGANQYPGFSSYYSNTKGDGGSSMLTIKGCSFDQHYIAIANNPSTGVLNGDNIRAENCNVNRCHTFWACGETQSRSNSIDNVYGQFLHTFINGMTIGVKSGTAPTVTNINLAGFTKQVVNINSLFGPIRFSNCYMEGIWSLGYANANNVAFNQCQIKFKMPSTEIFAPPYHFYTPYSCTFRDCSIEYFDNCLTKAPIMFKSGALLISGGWVEGGVIVSNGYTNAGGDLINNIKFENVYIKCLSQFAGKDHIGIPLANSTGKILMQGDEIVLNRGGVHFVNNEASNYTVRTVGTQSIDIDSTIKIATFIATDPGRFQVGDNLFTSNSVNASNSDMQGGSGIKSPLGYVSAINGDTITVSSVPNGFPEGSTILYGVYYPRFIQPIFGDFTSGNDTIKNFVGNVYPAAGTKLFNSAIAAGTYIKEINTTSKYIIISTNAAVTQSFSLISLGAYYNQNIYVDKASWPISSTLLTPYRQGTVVRFSDPSSSDSYYGYICTQGGIDGSSSTPVFNATTW